MILYFSRYRRFQAVTFLLLASLLFACEGGGSADEGTADGGSATGAQAGSETGTNEGATAGEAQDTATDAPQGGEVAEDFEAVVAAAEEEGEVEIWAYSPEEKQALEDAFNERFGTDIRFTGQDLRASEAAARLLTEADAGVATADFMQPSFDIAVEILDRELVPDEYPWMEVFGEELPGLDEAVESVELDVLAGRVLNHRDVIYALAYRTDLITAEELPSSWEDLADPEYRGRFAIDVRGYPFNYLAVDLGEEETLDLVRRIKENDPLLVEGSSAVGAAVSGGEVPFAVGGLDVQAQLAGVPLEVHYLEPVPLNQLVALVPTTAPHPNAGRLFAAWHSVEGFRVLEEAGLDYSARATQEDLRYAASLYEQLPDPEFVRIKNKEDLELVDRITAELARILSGT